jgi:elongation factor Ts
MADVSAALVKQLRERTGAGMMDCKKALADTEGDIEAAVDWLRQKGLSQAAKKAGRTAADGLIGVHTAGTSGAIVEVNAETDFVARNETFQEFVGKVTELAQSAGGDLETLKRTTYPETGRSVEEELTQTIATIGENMKLSRAAALSVDRGAVSAYVHNQLAPNLGKIGVLVALEADVESEKLEGLAKQLAMHVAAAQPNAVSQADIDPDVVERERRVLEQQARDSGKPENIIEKMVEGRLRKFYEEIALLDQLFVVDGESRVRDVIKQASDNLGTEVKVAGFVRFSLGEGAESESEEESAESA